VEKQGKRGGGRGKRGEPPEHRARRTGEKGGEKATKLKKSKVEKTWGFPQGGEAYDRQKNAKGKKRLGTWINYSG